jgi:hypothetical protein
VTETFCYAKSCAGRSFFDFRRVFLKNFGEIRERLIKTAGNSRNLKNKE